MNYESEHYYHLHDFIRKRNLKPVLNQINKTIDDLVAVEIEPIWLRKGFLYNSMCDYIFAFNDGSRLPGEMKRSIGALPKAIKQLKQGKLYCQEIYGYKPNMGLYVRYDDKKYHTQILEI